MIIRQTNSHVFVDFRIAYSVIIRQDAVSYTYILNSRWDVLFNCLNFTWAKINIMMWYQLQELESYLVIKLLKDMNKKHLNKIINTFWERPSSWMVTANATEQQHPWFEYGWGCVLYVILCCSLFPLCLCNTKTPPLPPPSENKSIIGIFVMSVGVKSFHALELYKLSNLLFSIYSM